MFCKKKIEILFLSFSIICLFSNFSLQGQERKKNVIFIMVDDLNDWITPYNGSKYSNTPNIDRLASLGSVFTQAWPTVAWCNPSRVSILTGIHPLNSGVVSNIEYPLREHLPYVETIVETFSKNEYFTKGMGKIFHSIGGTETENESWDEYDEFKARPVPETTPAHGNQELIDQRGPTADWAGIEADIEEWGDYKITLEGINFIQNHKPDSKPFFLSFGYRLPHLPWFYPKAFGEEFEHLNITLPSDSILFGNNTRTHSLIKKSGLWQDATKAYLSSVKFIDFNIGLVLDAIESNGLLESSIIIFISDHGFHLGEKGRWEKVTMWNESLKTPLIIYDPSLQNVRKEINESVNLIDVFPTLLDLTEIKVNKFHDGKSLKNLLLSADHTSSVSFATHPRGYGAIIKDDFKYVKIGDFNAVFDLKSDFSELNPLNSTSLQSYYDNKLDSIFNSYKVYDFLEKLKNIRIDTIDNQLNITWDKSSLREVYEVQFSKDTISSSYTQFTIEKPALNIDFPDVKTFVRVRSVNPKYKSDWSNFDELPIIINNIKSSTTSEITIYPNPAKDQITIHYEGTDLIGYKITSLSGQLIQSNKLKNSEQIDISNIPSGIYFLSLTSTTNVFLKKMVINTARK